EKREAGSLAMSRCVQAPVLRNTASALDESRAVRLIEVAQASGIDFLHFDPVTDRQYISETIGSGAAWMDYDGDGWLDLVLITSAPMPGSDHPPQDPPQNRFYRNRASAGGFEDVSSLAWASSPGFGQGCAVGDFDNDGFDDLYVSYYL